MAKERVKNLCGKRVALPYRDNAYEIWSNGSWTWYVLKKYQLDDNKENARWLTLVESPYTPDGEFGDSYVKDIKKNAVRIK